MVARIWRGYTSLKDADAYEAFLKKDFMPSVERKKITGHKKFQLLRRDEAGEVAFITIMWFEDLEKIKAFAGEDYEKAVVHPTAHALLKRYDDRSLHLEVRHELNYA